MRLTVEVIKQENHKGNTRNVDDHIKPGVLLAVTADGVGIVKGKQTNWYPKKVVDMVAANEHLN